LWPIHAHSPLRRVRTRPLQMGHAARRARHTADPDAWKLTPLIEVALDTNVLPSARADTIDQVLRDYRNFVHPQKEKKAKHECNEAEAGLAKYGLDGVCDYLEKTL
jgi:hypothetical protein